MYENRNLPNWVSPLMLGVVVALCWLIYGALHSGKEYNQIYFVVGIPVLLLSIGLHCLIRRWTEGNMLAFWLIELVICSRVAYYIR